MKPRSVLVENVSTEAITDEDTIIYTVPLNTRAKWVLAFMSNHTGSTISNVDLEIVNSGYIPVLGGKSLGAGESIQFESTSGYVMMEPGYEIRARADGTGVSCIITIEESSGNVSFD